MLLRQALYVKADLVDADQAKAVIAAADEKFGRIDGLVNSAAVAARGEWYDVVSIEPILSRN